MQEIQITSGLADLLDLVASLLKSGYTCTVSTVYEDSANLEFSRILFYKVEFDKNSSRYRSCESEYIK